MAHLAWIGPLLALAAVLVAGALRGRYTAERRLSGLRRALRARRRRPADALLATGLADGRVLAPRRAARLAGVAIRSPPVVLATR